MRGELASSPARKVFRRQAGKICREQAEAVIVSRLDGVRDLRPHGGAMGAARLHLVVIARMKGYFRRA